MSMRVGRLVFDCWLASLLLGADTAAAADGPSTDSISDRMYHLGVAGHPEWQEFVHHLPDAARLDLDFDSSAAGHETTLFLRQEDVKQTWTVELNDRKLGQLELNEARLTHGLAVPAGTLREGRNHLSIVPSATPDDIRVGQIRLVRAPRDQAIDRAHLQVSVTDRERGRGLPCRITIVDERGELVPLYGQPELGLAVRTGVVYTVNGRAQIGLRPGRYTVFATRGFEYGLATARVQVEDGQTERVSLSLAREVETPGLVSCDTHIHTVTYSGHGDATIDERVVTLAGEGIELAVATDHNIFTDFRPAAARAGVDAYFTPVIGAEVTTQVGHVNAFPFPPEAKVPDWRLNDWPSLIRAIRAEPGDRAIVLNHPRDLHSGFRPFDPANFNAVLGEHRRWPELGFDAVEVINSGAMQTDPMQPFHDWMAMLNHGERITAVAASDSHDVSRFIVGQGRTYLECPDEDAGHLDATAAIQSLKSGRALVSLGLLVQMRIDDRFGPGALASGLTGEVPVLVRVLGPSWVEADHVVLYANGHKIREQSIEAASRAGIKAEIRWNLPRPAHDVHLIAIASGPGVTEPYWPIARPYQPTSLVWTTRVMGATNPVYVDGDGDGRYSSPRGLAQSILKHAGMEPAAMLHALAPYDEAVAAQAAGLCIAAGQDVRAPAFVRALEEVPEPVRRGFHDVIGSLEKR